MKAAAASPAERFTILTSAGFMPFLARAVASTKCECCAEMLAPSLLRIFGLTAKAAASAARAISTAPSASIIHG